MSTPTAPRNHLGVARFDVHQHKPACAVAEMSADVLGIQVGSVVGGPGIQFAVTSGDEGVAVQVCFTNPDPAAHEMHMATLAVSLIGWLREHRPQSDAHDMLEDEFGMWRRDQRRRG